MITMEQVPAQARETLIKLAEQRRSPRSRKRTKMERWLMKAEWLVDGKEHRLR